MGFEIPGILWRRDPQGEEWPLVFDSPHSGSLYPDDFAYRCEFEVLRRAEDAYVDELYGRAPEVGATLIAALFPRSYLDANRAAEDLDPALIDGPWPFPLRPSEKTRAGLGLVRRVARPGIAIYDRKLGVDEVLSRIERCHRPYHRVLEETCKRLLRKFGVVWHVNCHSMPHPAGRLKDADFILGDRDGTTCAPEFTRFLADTLRRRGYRVYVNEMYKGVEIVRRRGRPAEGCHSVQIEVARRLYMDERTGAKTAGFARLKADVGDLVASLRDFAGEQLEQSCRAGSPRNRA
jgi:N-formylglutamate amidohydrolase